VLRQAEIKEAHFFTCKCRCFPPFCVSWPAPKIVCHRNPKVTDSFSSFLPNNSQFFRSILPPSACEFENCAPFEGPNNFAAFIPNLVSWNFNFAAFRRGDLHSRTVQIKARTTQNRTPKGRSLYEWRLWMVYLDRRGLGYVNFGAFSPWVLWSPPHRKWPRHRLLVTSEH